MKTLITTEQWEYIREFLPKQKIMGCPRVDDKKLLNGIMYVLKTGCRWDDMPKEYGNGKTANRRFKELEKIRFFEKLNEKLLSDNHKLVELKKISIDSSTVTAKKGGDCIGFDGNKKQKGTKVNLSISDDYLILSRSIMSANRNDVISFEEVINSISIKNGKVGRPKSKPESVYADAIYDTKNIRKYLRSRDIVSNIPINKKNRKKPKKERAFNLNKDYLSVRGSIERVYGWLKMRFRKLQIRYEYLAKNFLAFLDFAIFFHNWKLLR